MKIIIACRHGESYKNLKNLYGGKGNGLTDVGVTQVKELAKKLKELQKKSGLGVNIYKSCERVQINETADIVANELGVKDVKMHHNFCPIRLGVFDGMSRQKQLELYPNACEAHVKWEKGEIDITESECLVEGMQKASEYVDQMKEFIENLPDNGIYILCGTRSDMSCLHNIFKGNDPRQYKSYKYYDFTYAATTSVSMDENNKVLQHNFNGLNLNGEKDRNFVDKEKVK